MSDLWKAVSADITLAYSLPAERPPRLKHWLGGLLWSRSVQTMLCYRLGHAAHQRGIALLPHLLRRIPSVLYGADVSFEAQLGPGVFLHHLSGIVIGHGVRSAGDLQVYQGVTLGKGTSEWHEDMPTLDTGVQVFAGAKVLGNIHVGANAVIAANAVVTRDVPAEAVVAGIPATIVRLHGERVAQPDIDLTARLVALEKEVAALRQTVARLENHPSADTGNHTANHSTGQNARP